MNLLGSLAIALSMYSKIPVPQVKWTEERMKYAMCFFPCVGVVAGALLLGYQKLLQVYPLSDLAYACIGAVLPLVLTGGIHMDGFADVADARASFQTREKKLEILKDPHIGAFALIGCLCYMLLYVAAFAQLPGEGLIPLAAVPVLSRSLSGLAVVSFPKAKNSGLAAAFSGQAHKLATGIAMTGYFLLSLLWIFMTGGLLTSLYCLLASALVFFYYYRMSSKEFGGITGDLAGYFLQVLELILLALLAASV